MTTVQTSRYTRADYMRLPEGFPAELVDGMLVKEPSPTGWHQELGQRLVIRLRERIGPALPSPIDVFIDDYNVLQPDVAVLPAGTTVGPEMAQIPIPVFVVEVLSPSTAKRDRGTKTAIYLRAGVKEVWLVDPETETVEIATASGRENVGPKTVARAKTLAFDMDLAELFKV